MPDPDRPVDFFVSHADADLEWAEWIAAELESAGYGVIMKAWDFRPGENVLARHDEALATCRHTICVLSEHYVDSEAAARTAAQYQHLAGKERALIPVKVADCDPPPTLAPTIAIDLSGTEDPGEAGRLLLAGVSGRTERVARRGFPGARGARVRFPGTPTEVWDLRGHRADPFFTGREDVLAGLHRDLRAGRPTSAVQAITGLGGQGKTALAVEYAFRHAAAYDLVWWIRAEDPATMRGDYVELAEELGLPAEKDDQAIAALRRELRRRRDWLLIFDNAEEPEELFQLLPERHRGHVLITSRLREWPYTETQRLDVLPAATAVAYLRRRGRVADDSKATDIAGALGCLPLALVQAAGVIARMGAADYLDLLRQQESRLFAEGGPVDRERTVATTWRVSIDRLARQSPAAVTLFRLCAFLAADAIPLARLAAIAHLPPELAEALADPLGLAAITAALEEYSLAETADGLLSIHRLVQAVTRAELADDAPRWASTAVAVIAAAFPGNEDDPACWERCEELLAHALACTALAADLGGDTVATIGLLNRVASYLLARGRLDSAGDVLDQAFTAARDLAGEAPVYLSCRNTYGRLLSQRGDSKAAQVVQQEVYQARTRVLGSEDPDTLRAGRDYANTLDQEGRWTEAAALHDRLVESFTAVLGPDHLETITALACRAGILRTAGNYREALALEERVVAVRDKMLGDNHPSSLLARSHMAATLYSMGEMKRASVIEEQVLDAQIRVLGKEHPQTLAAKASLATSLYALGELGQARSMEEQVMEAQTRILGEDHPVTIEAKVGLAVTLRNMGEMNRAQALLEEVLETRLRISGEDHPATTDARSYLAQTLSDAGDHPRAMAIEEQVLQTRTRTLGEENPRTIDSMQNLACMLLQQGEQRDLDRARTLLNQVLEVRIRLLGKDSPMTFDTLAYLAMTLRELNELDEARAIGQEVLSARTRMFGADNLRTLAAQADLAMTLFALGNRDDALSLLAKSADIAFRKFGVRHTATTEAAWQMVQNCGPHEAARRRALIIRYLSWLGREKSGQLTASQKKIKEGLDGRKPTEGRKQSASRKKPSGQQKKRR